MFEDRFVYSHVPRAARRRGDEKSPVSHGCILLESHFGKLAVFGSLLSGFGGHFVIDFMYMTKDNIENGATYEKDR